MKWLIGILLFCVPLSVSSGLAATEPIEPVAYTYRVINQFPHDDDAFTQGLVFHDGILFEGTGRYGESSLRRVTLETGQVRQISRLDDDLFGEGITLFGDRLIQLTWRAGIGFVYNADTFRVQRTFTIPTEGWGLTHDGETLIMSNGTSELLFLDPEDFSVLGRLNVVDKDGPVANLNELEYIHGEVFANVWLTDEIVRIDPRSGHVIGRIDLTGLIDHASPREPVDVLNGIAYDEAGDRLFVTGKWWPALFEIELIPQQHARPAILHWERSTDAVRFQFRTRTDSRYQIEMTTRQPAETWEPLGDSIPGSGYLQSKTFPYPQVTGAHFFRLAEFPISSNMTP